MSTTGKKITSAASAIADRLAGHRATIEQLEAETVELERQQRWAEGEERRTRLGEIRAEAEERIGADRNEGAEIARLAQELAEASRRLHEAGHARNARIAALGRRAIRERVKTHGGALPPSPADNGVGVIDQGKGLVAGRWRIHPVDVVRLAVKALDAGAAAASDGTKLPNFEESATDLDDQLPPLPDPETTFYYQAPHGGVFAWTTPAEPHQDLAPISQMEWLAATWGVDLDELPADVRADAEDVAA